MRWSECQVLPSPRFYRNTFIMFRWHKLLLLFLSPRVKAISTEGYVDWGENRGKQNEASIGQYWLALGLVLFRTPGNPPAKAKSDVFNLRERRADVRDNHDLQRLWILTNSSVEIWM